jgi:SAM-dependent methyltransferase
MGRSSLERLFDATAAEPSPASWGRLGPRSGLWTIRGPLEARTGRIADMDTGRATCFGAWADEYHDWRPTYPDAAVDWLVPHHSAHVAEVGAGTGKLTDRLVERGLELDVVEPDGRMLRVVEERHPGLRTHERGAAHLPLGDASVDAVLVADAWHWFPKSEAAAEVARVLRPGGWLGCAWNVPVLEHDWEWRALRLDPALQPPADPLDRLGLSTGRVKHRAFRWTWDLSPQQWRGFVSTVSHVRLLPPDEYDAVLAETERLVEQACAAAGAVTAPLTHDAWCVRWYPEV